MTPARYINVVRLREIATGKVFGIINTHTIAQASFDAQLTDPKRIPLPAASTSRCCTTRSRRLFATTEHVFAMGDLNVNYLADRVRQNEGLPTSALGDVVNFDMPLTGSRGATSLLDYGMTVKNDSGLPAGQLADRVRLQLRPRRGRLHLRHRRPVRHRGHLQPAHRHRHRAQRGRRPRGPRRRQRRARRPDPARRHPARRPRPDARPARRRRARRGHPGRPRRGLAGPTPSRRSRPPSGPTPCCRRGSRSASAAAWAAPARTRPTSCWSAAPAGPPR